MVKGVETNIPFLIKLLKDSNFVAGTCWTTFIDDNPQLLTPSGYSDETHGVLRFLADAAVNGSRIEGQTVRL